MALLPLMKVLLPVKVPLSFEKAVAIAVRETSGFLGEYPGFEKIIFACFDRIMLNLYRQELARLGK